MKLIVVLIDRPGALALILQVFASERVNLNSISTLAITARPGTKAFYLHFDPNDRLIVLIDEGRLQHVCIDFKIVQQRPQSVMTDDHLKIIEPQV